MSLASVLSLLRGPFAVRFARTATTAGMIGVAALVGSTAMAAPSAVEEVSQLLDKGKVKEAAQRVQAQLKKTPGDAQLRFLQGVIASEQKNYTQAIETFVSLTRDHPGMPEPYNNLAVLYAAKGDERKAAEALEQAIRTHSSYATAHQNLGDLYARMANDAYAKALQLDSQRAPAPPKLSLIKQLQPVALPARLAEPATAPTAPVATAAQATPAVTVPIAAPAVTEAVAPVSEPTPAAAPRAPKPTAAPTVAATETTKPAPLAEPAKDEAHRNIEQAVSRWAHAWSSQNISAYYAAYSARFKPAGGETLAQWKADRKERIVGKTTITVSVRDLKISTQGDLATASFRQSYAAGSYKATTRKTLRMQREGAQWLIVREETGA